MTSRKTERLIHCRNQLTIGGPSATIGRLCADVRRRHAVVWSNEFLGRSDLVGASSIRVAHALSRDIGMPILDVSIVDELTAPAEKAFEVETGRLVLGACLPVPAKVAGWGRYVGDLWKIVNWGTRAIVGEVTVAMMPYARGKTRVQYVFETEDNPPTGVVRALAERHPDVWIIHSWENDHRKCGGSVFHEGREKVVVTGHRDLSETSAGALARMEDRMKRRAI